MNGNDSAAVPSDTDVTQVKPEAEQARLAAEASGVAVPGYTIESTLGRGGMGVVYKATQSGLNRVVALKMLIAGQYADPALRARFLLEAESVAALEHPHIVRVFAFGEQGGHPYLAMEYLPGGTLAERIKKGGPLPAREATELLAKLAEAVAHAHSRGVVHRDIKPLNVLLTAEGEPRLTDFGLAKVGRADQNLSVTGQVLGTPAYMAPEQAAGKVHEVGTAADVYALGAVLYDALTGRPPFQGDSAAVTLQKVLTEEPQRPRKLIASIPHDLETICLKCLEKDPAKRYPTAQALADDLLRYLRNEPITVRPAGTLERGYKWVKRNKVVAGAMAAVALALLVGAGVSLGFGLEAQKQAEEARKKRKEAEEATEREEKAKIAAITTGNALKESQDKLHHTLAKALLGPITVGSPTTRLSGYEEASLWELAEQRGSPVGMLFVEHALRTPESAAQLACRAKFAFHAAIGLDARGRDAADQLLLARLEQDLLSPVTVRLAQTSSRWGDASPALAARTAAILATALATAKDPDARSTLSHDLSVVAARLTPDQAAGVARVLIGALDRGADADGRQAVASALATVVKHMNPKQAAEMLVGALDKEREFYSQWAMVECLSAVAPRLDPDYAAVVAQSLAKRMSKADRFERERLAKALSAVAARMKPDAAAGRLLTVLRNEKTFKERNASVLETLAGAVAEIAIRVEPNPGAKVLLDAWLELAPLYAVEKLAKGFSALAPRLDSERAAQIIDVLLDTPVRGNGSFACERFREALSALATRMGLDRATRRVEGLAVALAKEPNVSARAWLAEELSAVAAGLPRHKAAEACMNAADALLAARERERDARIREQLAEGLSALAPHLEPKGAEKIADAIVAALRERKGSFLVEIGPPRYALIRALMAMTARVDSERAVAMLVAAVGEEPDDDARRVLAADLSAAARRLKPGQAAKAARALTEALIKERYVAVRRSLAEGLSAVAANLNESEADICAPAVDVLVTALHQSADWSAREQLAEALSAIAGCLNADQAAKAADALVVILKKELDSQARERLANALSAIARQLSPARAAAMTEEFVAAVVAESDPKVRSRLGDGLVAVARRLNPEQATKAADLLVTAIDRNREKGRDGVDPEQLVLGLAAVAEHARPDRAADVLAAALVKEGRYNALWWLADGLMRVAPLVERDQAARIAEVLVAVVSQEAVSDRSERLAEILSAFLLRTASRNRISAACVGCFATSHNISPSLALLHPYFHPLPRPLPPQTLVELLKHPFCVGEARRAVLDALEFTYKRKFADQWEFVKFVQDNDIRDPATSKPLDLLTPPKRPQQP